MSNPTSDKKIRKWYKKFMPIVRWNKQIPWKTKTKRYKAYPQITQIAL